MSTPSTPYSVTNKLPSTLPTMGPTYDEFMKICTLAQQTKCNLQKSFIPKLQTDTCKGWAHDYINCKNDPTRTDCGNNLKTLYTDCANQSSFVMDITSNIMISIPSDCESDWNKLSTAPGKPPSTIMPTLFRMAYMSDDHKCDSSDTIATCTPKVHNVANSVIAKYTQQ